MLYGGFLAVAVGLFIPAGQAVLGHVLRIGGGLAVALGVLLVVLRSRLKP